MCAHRRSDLRWGHRHHHLASRTGIASTVASEAIATARTLPTLVKAHEFFNTTGNGIQSAENRSAAQVATTPHGVARIAIATDAVASSVINSNTVAVVTGIGRLA